MYIVYIALITILVSVAFGILIEKGLHPNYSLAECTRSMKGDIRTIVRILFTPGTVRHVFDETLWESISKILSDYNHSAFSPVLQATFIHNVPAIYISFVPNRKLESEDITGLCRLINLKFNHYLRFYELNWKHFIIFHQLNDTVTIHLYFSEFPEDEQMFMKQYRIAIKQKATPDFGVLRDEALDQELRRVR